jgi:hypothetical protein
MKKLILTSLALVAGMALGYSQGAITIANSTSTYFISTDTGTPAHSGTVGKAGGAGNYYYTVLATAYPGTGVPAEDNASLANASIWTWTGVSGDSYITAGGIALLNGNTTSANGTFGLSTAATYASAPTEYYVIVGWSKNEGTTWAAVSSELANNSLVQGGFFGVSPVAFQEAGGSYGSGSQPTVNLFGNPTALTGGGLSSGFDLYATVPEPSTIALGVMGAASLLALRRKKA